MMGIGEWMEKKLCEGIDKENADLRQWARDTYKVGTEIPATRHSVFKDECNCMNKEEEIRKNLSEETKQSLHRTVVCRLHAIKTYQSDFWNMVLGYRTFDIVAGEKRHEIVSDDLVHFREYNLEKQSYTGKCIEAVVTYTQRRTDYLVFSFRITKNIEVNATLCSDSLMDKKGMYGT